MLAGYLTLPPEKPDASYNLRIARKCMSDRGICTGRMQIRSRRCSISFSACDMYRMAVSSSCLPFGRIVLCKASNALCRYVVCDEMWRKLLPEATMSSPATLHKPPNNRTSTGVGHRTLHTRQQPRSYGITKRCTRMQRGMQNGGVSILSTDGTD